MKVRYNTTVHGYGNHASIEIPDNILAELGGNKRAPLKITVNGYTYQSTATGVDGTCMVVFPMRDREAAGVNAGDNIEVALELDSGYRKVIIPDALAERLDQNHLTNIFHDLTYSKRKEFARLVADAKTDETRTRRIEKIIGSLQS